MQSLLLFEPGANPKRRSWLTRSKPQRAAQRAVLGLVHRHPVRNVLLLGQPKSGTTWLRRMLCEVPGYRRWSPPTTEWWNDHPLERRSFDPPPLGYTVTRVHSGPTPKHLELVRDLGRPAVLVLRDLRDVAVSWAYFVDNSTFPMPQRVRSLPIGERIDVFIDELLPAYHQWAQGWAKGPDCLLRVRYESLVADCGGELRRVLQHLRISLSESRIDAIVERHSFARRTGRTAGEGDPKSFDRKGVAGDWQSHFTEPQAARFARVIESLGGTELYDYLPTTTTINEEKLVATNA